MSLQEFYYYTQLSLMYDKEASLRQVQLCNFQYMQEVINQFI